MQADEIIEELRLLSHEPTKNTHLRHGAREPVFGVKIGDMAPIRKRIKTNYQLALDLYDTGISDAMYLAGLVADDPRMTRDDLQRWVEAAYWNLLSENTVPWVASGSAHGWELATRWLEDPVETIACAGWSTLSCILAMRPNSELDLEALSRLLNRVQREIHGERNRVKYNMNGFVISVGGYIAPLSEEAVRIATAVGPVSVDMGDTSCAVASAPEYIAKMHARGSLTKKRKTVKC